MNYEIHTARNTNLIRCEDRNLGGLPQYFIMIPLYLYQKGFFAAGSQYWAHGWENTQ